MIDIIMDSEEGKYRNRINKNKVLNELKWHKVAYNSFYKPTQTASADVYFNHDDEGHGLFLGL